MTSQHTNGRRDPDARLLVVEDEPNILELLAASLRYSGFEVITAAAGTRRSRQPSGTARTSSSWM